MEFINLLWKSKGRKSKCSSCKMNNVCRAIPWCWQNKRCVCDILTCVQQRKLCYIYHVHNTRNLPIFSFMCSKNRCQSSTLPVFLYWLVFRILQHMTVSRSRSMCRISDCDTVYTTYNPQNFLLCKSFKNQEEISHRKLTQGIIPYQNLNFIMFIMLYIEL